MLMVEQYDSLLAAVVAFSGLAVLVVRTSRRHLPYPPRPRRLPIVGNLFSMPSREEWKSGPKIAVSACSSHPAHLFPSIQPYSGSGVVHVDVMVKYICGDRCRASLYDSE